MASDGTKQGAGLLGVGAAACAACCAGPIFGVLAAAGLLTAAAYITAGLVGLAVAVPFGVWAYRRRKNRTACAAETEPAHVEIGTKPASAHSGAGRTIP
jgi:hypothetical protein